MYPSSIKFQTRSSCRIMDFVFIDQSNNNYFYLPPITIAYNLTAWSYRNSTLLRKICFYLQNVGLGNDKPQGLWHNTYLFNLRSVNVHIKTGVIVLLFTSPRHHHWHICLHKCPRASASLSAHTTHM